MNRNFGLDIVRAIAIWLVLLQHGGVNIPGLTPLKIGGIGVEFFFVLSGFLIGGILFREIDKQNSIPKTLASFWVRRWFRILPLYYAVLLFKFIVIDSAIGWNILYYVFFLQNNFYGIDYFGVSWSLVIEEWFYLFAPIFIMLSNKILKTEKKVFFSLITFLIFVNLIRILYVYQKNVPYEGVNGNFPFRFDSLFLGVILAFLKHKKWSFFEKLQSPVVFFTGMGLFLCYIYYYRTLSFPDNLINQSFFPRTVGFFILPFTISLTIPYISTIEEKADSTGIRKIIFELITITSVLTYAIYLLHPFVFAITLDNAFILKSKIIGLPIAILFTYIAAWITYQIFEKPILKYRDKITSSNKK